MSYRIRVWCSDCINVDPLGCFDGGSVYATGEDFVTILEWPTRENAEDIRDQLVRERGSPWVYEVEEVPGVAP